MIVPPLEKVECQREDSENWAIEYGVEGMRESPGSVRDPDVQHTGDTDEEVAWEVLEVQDMFLRSV